MLKSEWALDWEELSVRGKGADKITCLASARETEGSAAVKGSAIAEWAEVKGRATEEAARRPRLRGAAA